MSNNNKGTVDPVGSDPVSINSLYYSEKPDFVPIAQWGNIGLPNPLNQGTIPAFDRIQDGNPFLNTCGEIVTSTSELDFAQGQVSLYPNPTKGKIRMESESMITKIEIFDLSGRLVEEQTFNHHTFELDITTLNPGVYTVKLYSSLSGSQIVKRIVKIAK